MPIFLTTAAMYQAFGLVELGRTDEAVAAFARIGDRFGASDDSDLAMAVIAATVERGALIDGANGVAAAVEKVMDRYRDLDEPRIRGQLATARLQQAAAYRSEGRPQEMAAAVEALQAEFGSDASEVAQAAVAGGRQLVASQQNADSYADAARPEHLALLETARLHVESGNTDGGVAILDEIIERWGDASDDSELAAAVHARLMKAAVIATDDADAAAANLEEIIDRFDGHRSIEVRRQVAAARINRGVELTKSADPQVTGTWFERTVAWIEETDGGELDTQLAVAMFYTAMSAMEADDSDRALDWFGRIVDRWNDSTDPSIRNIVARAMLNSAAVLVDLDQPEMTLAALDVLLDRYGAQGAETATADAADLAAVVASARAFRAELTGEPS